MANRFIPGLPEAPIDISTGKPKVIHLIMVPANAGSIWDHPIIPRIEVRLEADALGDPNDTIEICRHTFPSGSCRTWSRNFSTVCKYGFQFEKMLRL